MFEHFISHLNIDSNFWLQRVNCASYSLDVHVLSNYMFCPFEVETSRATLNYHLAVVLIPSLLIYVRAFCVFLRVLILSLLPLLLNA